jgi:hypothetical protein
MQQIGDFFSAEFRKNQAEINLKVGAVLRYENQKSIPPKIKIVIVVGFDLDNVLLAFVFVNSEINPNLFYSSRLKDLHLLLEAEKRSYLSHNSFVDCSQIKEEEIEFVKTRMIENTSTHIGNLNEIDLEYVLNTLKSSFTISPKQKSKFGLEC